MSLQAAARHMASQGRGPDTTLVHMSPKEVKSLQALAMAHGGSLTINPQTGLPEAGFLSSILPLIAGMALGPAGFALMSAPMAGLAVGAATGLATGSLNKGLMAGFGAYGGAGLSGALSGAGAATADATASALGVPGAATGAGSQAAMLAAQNQGFGQAGLEALGSSAGYASGATPVVQSGLQSMSAGAQGLLTEQGRNEFMKNVGGSKGLMQYGGALAAPLLSSSIQTKTPAARTDSEQMRYSYDPGREETPTQTGGIGEYTYFRPSFTRLNPTTAMAAEGGTMTSDYTYDPATQLYKRVEPVTPAKSPMGGLQMIAGGEGPSAAMPSFPGDPNSLTNGLISAMFGNQGQPSAPVSDVGSMAAGTNAPGGATFGADIGVPDYGVSVSGAAADNVSPESTFASGGISHLGDYSDGGRLLRGPGDGVSDSIPAMIANKRPARLADGEFVVPARIVSELGNGSTEAGARKLYAMMDRIQKNRSKSVGKGKVAVNSRSEKMLPA